LNKELEEKLFNDQSKDKIIESLKEVNIELKTEKYNFKEQIKNGKIQI